MKTLGQVAAEAFGPCDALHTEWHAMAEDYRARWEGVARAVAFAVEEMDAEQKRTACERGPLQPTGIAPGYGHHFTCHAAPDPLYPGYRAKVRA